MNWKAFTTACISTVIISFPQNIIGCGGETDPYDYYISFFHQNLPEVNNYRPFYYTGYSFLYDVNEPAPVPELLATEWAGYCAAPVKADDAKMLMNKFAWKDLNNLYYHLEKNQPLKIPDSVKQNSMTQYFMRTKDLEALGYILYAKQVEPYVTGSYDDWESIKRDSVRMAKLIKNGQLLHTAAKKDFFKLKYGYQVLRLAHYSGRYDDVINWYDEYATVQTGNNVLGPLCTALKAGALFRTGKQKEAAYLFSKAFSGSVARRVSNYLGFTWAVTAETDKKEYLDLCSNDTEKANMLAMFALGSPHNDLENLKEIYRLQPGNEQLEVLVVREVNKLEETYLTPSLQSRQEDKTFYLSWAYDNTDSIISDAAKEVQALASFLHDAAQTGMVKNPGLFETAAAYTAYMARNYSIAKTYLAAAEKMPLTQKVKDQWALTGLLITINEKEKIDAAFEEQLLPSLRWLEEKVKSEKTILIDYWHIQQWAAIYRNLMREIVAKRYHEQGDIAKEALSLGTADWVLNGNWSDYTTQNGISFLRNNLMSKDVEELYALMTNKQASKFESYLFNHNTIAKKDVIDFAGTSYLREYKYATAISWFKKSNDKSAVAKNPFIDLLYDQEEKLPVEKNIYTTKLAFAQEMLRLEKVSETDKKNAAKYYYKMALGMYNITHYGHTWELVQYNRSGSDDCNVAETATAFKKEYYRCYKAKAYFEKAMNTSADKNFKARCLFMMAKCAQKQVYQPGYYEVDTDLWLAFKYNKYFPQLIKEYGNTAFYKQAFNSCSYLRDFVQKK